MGPKRALPIVPTFDGSQIRKKKMKVLNEDAFVGALEHIIKRDFFPNLDKLRYKSEMAEALETRDYTRVRQIAEQYTPSVAHTPRSGMPSPAPSASTVRTSASAITDVGSDIPEAAASMSLDAFLNRYTSEDNASFDRLQEKASAERRAKHAWMFEESERYNRKLLEQLPATELEVAALKAKEAPLLLTAGPSTHQSTAQPNGQAKPSSGEPAIEGVSEGEREEPAAGQSTQPLQWKHAAMSALMYGPKTIPQRPAIQERTITYSNTRISAEQPTQVGGPGAGGTVYDAVGTVRTGKQGPSKVDLDDFYGTPRHPSIMKAQYPMLGTPSPSPSQLHGGRSPFMTWGDIEGTPLRLEDEEVSYEGAPVFQINEPSAREKKALQLSSNAQARMRRRKTQAAIGTPQFAGALSPAGRLLLSRARSGTPSRSSVLTRANSSSHRDMQLRQTYSSHAPRHTASPSPRSSLRPRDIPRSSEAHTPAQHDSHPSLSKTDSLTDGLLNL